MFQSVEQDMKGRKRKAARIARGTTRVQREQFMRLCQETKKLATQLMDDFDAGLISANDAAAGNRELMKKMGELQSAFVDFAARYRSHH
jgi:hypothetical protein